MASSASTDKCLTLGGTSSATATSASGAPTSATGRSSHPARNESWLKEQFIQNWCPCLVHAVQVAPAICTNPSCDCCSNSVAGFFAQSCVSHIGSARED